MNRTYTIVSLDNPPAAGEHYEIQQVTEHGEDSVDVTALATGEVTTTLVDAMAAHGYRVGAPRESGAGAYDYDLEAR